MEYNVEDILGGIETPGSTETASSEEDTPRNLAGRLSTWNESCRNLFVDLRTVNFISTPDDSYLEFQDKSYYDKKLYFKADPQNPKDPKVTHALKQFCKIIGIPFSFFKDCRPQLRTNMVSTWQAGLTEKDDKAQVIVKLRESRDCSLIRSFMPIKKCSLTNHELLTCILDSIEEPLKLEFVHGDGRDDLILHARLLFSKQFDLLGKKVCFGFSLMTSELDACPMTVDFLVHDIESKASFILTYGGEPCFKSNFEGLQTGEIKKIVPDMLDRIEGEIPEIISRIEARMGDVVEFEPQSEALYLCKYKGLNSKMKQSIYHQIAECLDEIRTPWDVARNASLVSKDFDIQKRVIIERACGFYLNLSFSKE